MKQKRVDDRLKKAVRKKRKKQTVVTGGGTNVSVQTTQNVTNITEANFLESLQDVSILYPAEGDGIFYDSVTGKWTNEQPTGGGGGSLDDLTDVTITTPSDGEVLTYDSGTSEWVNAAPTGGGGTPGGSDTEVQFNDGGAFNGITGATTDGTILNVTTASGGTNTTQAASTQFVQQELNSSATVANVGAKLYLFNAY